MEGRYPERYEGFAHFLNLYLSVSRLIRTPDDLATGAAAFARQQAAEGVLYTEATFTAITHVRNGMDPAAMWAALRSGLAEAGPDTQIRLIVDAVRSLGREDAEATIRLVEEADAPIVGLGLSNTEASAPEREFSLLREAADRLGLGLVAHAGEGGAPERVRTALDELGADRIGHGVAAARDPALIDRLVQERVPLEVCLSSNVSTGVFPSLEEHPFPQLRRAGVNVTINSDDPAFFSTTLTNELQHAIRLAGLTYADVAELQRRAARAAFAQAPVRDRLVTANRCLSTAPGSFGHPTSAWMMAREVVQDGGGGGEEALGWGAAVVGQAQDRRRDTAAPW